MIYELEHIDWLTTDDIILTDNSRSEHVIFDKQAKAGIDKIRLMICKAYDQSVHPRRLISTFHYIRYVFKEEVHWMYCFYEKRKDSYYVTLSEKNDDNQLLIDAYKAYNRDELIDKLLDGR